MHASAENLRHYGYICFAHVTNDVGEKPIWRAHLTVRCISLYIDDPWVQMGSHFFFLCILTFECSKWLLKSSNIADIKIIKKCPRFPDRHAPAGVLTSQFIINHLDLSSKTAHRDRSIKNVDLKRKVD